eukprot:403342087
MEKKNIAQPGQKDQTQSKKEFFNESLSHQGMVIDCYFYKNCKDQNLIQEQKVNSELKLFLKQQRYALYEIRDNPTQTQVMDVLEQGIKSNFSPSLKTFVLNLNGNAKIHPTSTNDILFMLKYDKAFKDISTRTYKSIQNRYVPSVHYKTLHLNQKLKTTLEQQSDEDREPTLAQSLSLYFSSSKEQYSLEKIFAYMIKFYKQRCPRNHLSPSGKDNKKIFRKEKRQFEYEKLAKVEIVQNMLQWKKNCKSFRNKTINIVQVKQYPQQLEEEVLDIKFIEDPSNFIIGNMYCSIVSSTTLFEVYNKKQNIKAQQSGNFLTLYTNKNIWIVDTSKETEQIYQEFKLEIYQVISITYLDQLQILCIYYSDGTDLSTSRDVYFHKITNPRKEPITLDQKYLKNGIFSLVMKNIGEIDTIECLFGKYLMIFIPSKYHQCIYQLNTNTNQFQQFHSINHATRLDQNITLLEEFDNTLIIDKQKAYYQRHSNNQLSEVDYQKLKRESKIQNSVKFRMLNNTIFRVKDDLNINSLDLKINNQNIMVNLKDQIDLNHTLFQQHYTMEYQWDFVHIDLERDNTFYCLIINNSQQDVKPYYELLKFKIDSELYPILSALRIQRNIIPLQQQHNR